MQQIWQYFRLVRLPNIFTAPSNVLVGYLVFLYPDILGFQVYGLMASSALLYISGIVFNDYFDFENDKISRPDRPLPSGKITRKRAASIAIAAIVTANIVALVSAGPAALTVSLVLSAVILAYDWRLKSRAFAGPIAMAGSRLLNVMLGASPALAGLPVLSYEILNDVRFQSLALASTSLFFYVISVMILSRREEEGASRSRLLGSATISYVIIALVGFVGYLIMLDRWFFFMLAALACVLSFTFLRNYRIHSPQSTQYTIRNMVLSIIILDSVFVTGSAGLLYGSATLLLLIPAVVFGRKMYVT